MLSARRAVLGVAFAAVLGVAPGSASAAMSGGTTAVPITDPAVEVGPSTTPVRKNVDMAALIALYGPPPPDAILPAQGGPVPGPPDLGALSAGPLMSPMMNGYGLRTVCARDVWVRDAPNYWSHGVMYKGDKMDPVEYKPTWIKGYPQNPGGNGLGWSERDAFC